MSPNQESEAPKDTSYISRAGVPSQHFFIEFFPCAVGDSNKNIHRRTQFLIKTGATSSIIDCETSQRMKKFKR